MRHTIDLKRVTLGIVMTTNIPSIARLICLIACCLVGATNATAADYQIRLIPDGGGVDGTGGFLYSNTGGVPTCAPVSGGATVGGLNFDSDSDFCVEIVNVSFNDGKDSEAAGSNQISGLFVEGLGGGMTDVEGNRITFTLVINGPNPNTDFVKEYTITASNGVVSASGSYAVTNLATVPEPGVLILFCLGLAALLLSFRNKFSPKTDSV